MIFSQKVIASGLTMILFIVAVSLQRSERCEKPEIALMEVARLVESQDWDRLASQRCFDREIVADQSVQQLAAAFQKRFSDGSERSLLEELSRRERLAQPTLGDDGRLAVFRSETRGATVSLALMDSGRWGLRL